MVYIYFSVYISFLCDGNKVRLDCIRRMGVLPHYLIVYDGGRETKCSFDEFTLHFSMKCQRRN